MTELANLVNAHPRTGGVGVGVGGVTHDMRPFLQNLAQQRWTSMEEGLSEENDSVSSSRRVLALLKHFLSAALALLWHYCYLYVMILSQIPCCNLSYS